MIKQFEASVRNNFVPIQKRCLCSMFSNSSLPWLTEHDYCSCICPPES